ncbi:MAG TPA: NAD-dependent epimerase/dehydratase family protein [Candidatus Saccharimonadales bacterium]|nr:NAD-dependent epimerase/dehydratase family protein [Candidatus Saccharimonadales bacterium]
MAKCLVLGADGFIGSHLVDSLVEKGHDIRAFDRFSRKKHSFKDSDKIEVMPGDFLNRHDLSQALQGVDYVFHFISTTTPASAEDDPLIDISTNIQMSVELFQECVKTGVKKVIFASTGGAIYGENSTEHVNEDTLPAPVSPYAIGKLTIEQYLRYFDKKFGLKALVFRISNPYGERQSLASRQGVIPIFLQHIAKGEPITILGDGSMIRDYIYVKDVADMVASSFETARNDLYNLGSGHGLSVNELVDSMRQITGREIQTEHAEKPPTYVDKVVLDVSRFESEFPGMAKTDLAEGMKATWQYVQKQSGERP